jgi:hypothetical protein
MDRLKTYRNFDTNASENETLTSVLKKFEQICDKHNRSLDKSLMKNKKFKSGSTLQTGALASLYAANATVVVGGLALKKGGTTAEIAPETKSLPVHTDNFRFEITNLQVDPDEKIFLEWDA